MTRARLLALLATLLGLGALVEPLARAQGDAGAARAPKEPKEPPVVAAATTAPAAPHPQSEAEPEEKDVPPKKDKDPKEKEPAVVKQATVVKDGMVRIPGGHFTMGSSDKAAPANERPARTVVVTPFWIDKTEVTVGAYKACVDRGACVRPVKASGMCTYDAGDPSLPVSCISWAMANTYCMAVGKRLPREVEWEHAARGPTPVKYPWGGAGTSCGMAATLSREGAFRPCSGKLPAKAGAHVAGASPFGVLDMAGNVEEWVSDWYAESIAEGSARAGAAHVLRGGGWLSSPNAARTTTRNWGSVRESGPNVGFRCARDDT